MPSRRIVVAGTGTEVGKTWVAARMLEHARKQGLSVAARKPAQSYLPSDNITDADLLAAASGESPYTVCPAHRWYPVAMAPPMAAEVLGLSAIHMDALLNETRLPEVDLALIETAGGLCSPIAHDGDNLELIKRLDPDEVILVADAGLGTLNAVRLCLRALARASTVFLNRFVLDNDLHRRNRDWLLKEGVRVVTDVKEVMGDE
jgi:dethiobiotin synthetase